MPLTDSLTVCGRERKRHAVAGQSVCLACWCVSVFVRVMQMLLLLLNLLDMLKGVIF